MPGDPVSGMSEHSDQTAASPGLTCAGCSKPLEQAWEFCPWCGAKTIPSSTTSIIDTYAKNRVDFAISDRLRDQATLVRELADKAEDTVWNRLKVYFWLFGLLLIGVLGFIAFLGLNTLGGVSAKIEPIVTEAERRAQAARQAIEETGRKVDDLKAAVDKLSSDVGAQTKRVALKGGEISRKFQSLDATTTAFSGRLEAMEKASENKIEQVSQKLSQVSKQADIFSVRQAYPTLGQAKFITYNYRQWKGIAAKSPNDMWINIYIDPSSTGNFSLDKIDNIVKALKTAGYEPLPGMFGIGGPYSGGYGPFGESSVTTVFYFKRKSEPMARDVAAMVTKIVSKTVEAKFVDIASFSQKDEAFVIEQSGLDLQLYLLQR